MKKESRRKVPVFILAVVLAGFMIAASTVLTPTPAASQTSAPKGVKPVTLKMDIFPSEALALGRIFYPGNTFDMLAKRYSDDLLRLDIIPGLFKTNETIWACSKGRVDITVGASPYISGDMPLWNVGQLPLLIRSVSEWYWASTFNPGFLKIWERTFNEKNLIYLGNGTTAIQQLWSSKKVDTVDGFKGLKVRASGVEQVMSLKKLGASAVALPYEELQPSLQRGTVDACVTGVYWGYRTGVHKMAPYVNMWPLTPIFTMSILVNKDVWEGLHPFLREALKRAAKETELILMGLARNEDYISEYALKKLGGHIITPSKEEVAKAAERVKPVWDHWIKRTGADGEALIKAIETSLKSFRE